MKAFLLLLFLAFLTGCAGPAVIINGETITVEIADSPEEREQGLMFRESLCSTCGMLFIFPEENIQTFWMKNTKIPLDMIFISKDFRIVDITQAEPCTKDPCVRYTSQDQALYVLEVPQGFSTAHTFSIEMQVRIRS